MKTFEMLVLGLVLTTLERIERMEKALTDAIANLNSEVADEGTKLGSIKTYVEGVPNIVASAVAQALANVGVEETAAAAEIEAARQQAAGSVADTLAAVNANTPASDTGGSTGSDTSGSTGTGAGSDTGGGTAGADTSGAGGGDTTGGAAAGADTSGTGGDTTGADAGGGTSGVDPGAGGGDTTGTGTGGDGQPQPI